MRGYPDSGKGGAPFNSLFLLKEALVAVGECTVLLIWFEVESLPKTTGLFQLKATNK